MENKIKEVKHYKPDGSLSFITYEEDNVVKKEENYIEPLVPFEVFLLETLHENRWVPAQASGDPGSVIGNASKDIMEEKFAQLINDNPGQYRIYPYANCHWVG